MANEIQELKFQVGEAWKGVYSSSTAYGLANVVQDPTGLSIYRSLKSGNVGHPLSNASWWFRIIDLSSIKAESDRIAALNQAIAQDEALRVAAEELRQQHEAERVSAETQRNEAEQARISAEQARVNAESARATAEQQRITAEQGRVSAESARVQAEQARVLDETLRANAEDQRAANEQNRVAAEQQRIERAEQDHQRAESDHAAYIDSLGAFDISSYHATDGVLAKYADLAAALGTDGANIPNDLRKGGMAVKFVQSSDNKYVQYRLMTQNFSSTESDWQGVDEEPVADSKNLVESGGVATKIKTINEYTSGVYEDVNAISVLYGNKIILEHLSLEKGREYRFNLKIENNDSTTTTRIRFYYSNSGVETDIINTTIAAGVSEWSRTAIFAQDYSDVTVKLAYYGNDTIGTFTIREEKESSVRESIERHDKRIDTLEKDTLFKYEKSDVFLYGTSGNIIENVKVRAGVTYNIYFDIQGTVTSNCTARLYNSNNNLIATLATFPPDATQPVSATYTCLNDYDNCTIKFGVYISEDCCLGAFRMSANDETSRLEDNDRLLSRRIDKTIHNSKEGSLSFSSDDLVNITKGATYVEIGNSTYKSVVIPIKMGYIYKVTQGSDTRPVYLCAEYPVIGSSIVRTLSSTELQGFTPAENEVYLVVETKISEVSSVVVAYSSVSSNGFNVDTTDKDAMILAGISTLTANKKWSFQRSITDGFNVKLKVKFPDNIHSTTQLCDILSVVSSNVTNKVCLQKDVVSTELKPYPIYQGGIVTYSGGTKWKTIIPDGWRNIALLGDDAFMIRFTGDVTDSANQDLTFKVTDSAVNIYHKTSSVVVASFDLETYTDIPSLVTAMKEESALADYEIDWLNIEGNSVDIIPCDVKMVAQYTRNGVPVWDAYPCYAVTKEKDKVHEIEVAVKSNESRVYLDGISVMFSEYNGSGSTTDTTKMLNTTDTFTIGDSNNTGIEILSIEFEDHYCLKHPNVVVAYIEGVYDAMTEEEGSTNLKSPIGWISGIADIARKNGWHLLSYNDLLKYMDGRLKLADGEKYFHLTHDDGTLVNSFMTNEEQIKVYERCGMLNAVSNAMMMNNVNSTYSDTSKVNMVKAANNAGVGIYIHTGNITDENIGKVSFTSLKADVAQAKSDFVSVFGNRSLIWDIHRTGENYGTVKYLMSQGFRLIFGNQSNNGTTNEYSVCLNQANRFRYTRYSLEYRQMYDALPAIFDKPYGQPSANK